MIILDERFALQQTESRSLEQSLFYRWLRDEIAKKYEKKPLKKELKNLIRTVEADEKISFSYNGLPIKPLLCLLDVSHGQAINWIEGEMVGKTGNSRMYMKCAQPTVLLILLIPDMSLWNIPFNEWTDEDKKHKCFSGLWDIERNRCCGWREW